MTGTDNDFQSLELEVDPISFQSHAGDRLRLRGIFRREDLLEDFEIRPGIVIPKDNYRFQRVLLDFESSLNRPFEFDLELECCDFFTGTRFDILTTIEWRLNRHVSLGFDYEQFQVRLPQGDFTTRIARARADFAFSASLSWINLIQWDNETDDLTWNSRLRWIIEPGNELFVVLNQGFDVVDRHVDATFTEGTVKIGYTFRF